jgi:hypothetical protein
LAWNVEIGWAPPRLSTLQPTDPNLSIEPGEALELAARATVADPAIDVRYEWTLDRAKQSAAGGRFRVPTDLSLGEHVVEVVPVDSRGLRGAARRWSIEVAKAAPPPPVAPPRVAPPPASATPPAASGGPITEQDARDWVSRYQRAFETRDADLLIALGALRRELREKWLETVNYEVKMIVTNLRVTVHGNQAHVQFDRQDGQSKVVRKEFRLERRGQSVVAGGT